MTDEAACHTLHHNAVASFYAARVHLPAEGERSIDVVAGLVANAVRERDRDGGPGTGTVAVGVHYGEERIKALVDAIRARAPRSRRGPPLNIEYVCGDSEADKKQELGPGGGWARPGVDVFIYNPVYGCGVDLSQAKACAAVFHLSRGVLGACACDQLTRRIRATSGCAIDIVEDEKAPAFLPPPEVAEHASGLAPADAAWARRAWRAAKAQHCMERLDSSVDFLTAVARSGGLLHWVVRGASAATDAHKRLAEIAAREKKYRVAVDAHLHNLANKSRREKMRDAWKTCVGDRAAKKLAGRIIPGGVPASRGGEHAASAKRARVARAGSGKRPTMARDKRRAPANAERLGRGKSRKKKRAHAGSQ